MTRRSGNRFLTSAELTERIDKAVEDARGAGGRRMTESEARAEGYAELEAFSTALHGLVEDAAGQGTRFGDFSEANWKNFDTTKRIGTNGCNQCNCSGYSRGHP